MHENNYDEAMEGIGFREVRLPSFVNHQIPLLRDKHGNSVGYPTCRRGSEDLSIWSGPAGRHDCGVAQRAYVS